jgi:ABC-type glycerol-3-phosphate transport system substrate-binding protein
MGAQNAAQACVSYIPVETKGDISDRGYQPRFGHHISDNQRLSLAGDTKDVQMLHWWTSGGEAAAVNVIKEALAKQGYGWKDVPVAGGGGAMTTLKAMVAAGNPPTASEILGYYAMDYSEAGKLADITPLAAKGD